MSDTRMYEGELTSGERDMLAIEYLPTNDSDLREWVVEDDECEDVETYRRYHNRPEEWRVSVYTERAKWTTWVAIEGVPGDVHVTPNQPYCDLMCRATEREWEVDWGDVPQNINVAIEARCEMLFKQEVKDK